MTDLPLERDSLANPLRVLVETPDGAFLPCPRMEVASLFLGCDDRISEATLTVDLGERDRSTQDAEAPLAAGDWLGNAAVSGRHVLMGPDTRVLITRERPGLDDDGSANAPPAEVVFAGFCPQIGYQETTGDGQTTIRGTLTVKSRLAKIDYARWAQIAGCWMRTATAADAARVGSNPATDDSASGSPADCAVVTALPAIFNPKGRGNCHRRPVSVEIEGYGTMAVHVFCAPDDPAATPWTWARVLRYLTCFHLFQVRTGEAWDDLGPVVDARVGSAGLDVPAYLPGGAFEKTEVALGGKALYLGASSARPAAPATRATAWAFAVLGEPRDWSAEGLTVVEAFVALAEAAGLHFCERAEAYPTDLAEPWRNRIYWWARGCGPIKDLYREVTRANQAGMSFTEFVRRSNVHQLGLEADYTDVTPNPYVLGAVRKYEVTVQLVPGWLADAHLDDVASVEDELAYAEEHLTAGLTPEDLAADPWYRRYHRCGLDFAAYSQVGRKWIANFSGRYQPSLYARTTGPFDTDRYAPWEPDAPYGPGATEGSENLLRGLRDPVIELDESGAWVLADEENWVDLAAGAWARTDRIFEEVFAADVDQRSLGIYVQWSIDSGAHWSRLTCSIRALAREGGIMIEADDLTALKLGDDETHFWEALLNNTLRLRVTAVIAGDRRIEPDVTQGPWGADVVGKTCRYFDVAERYLANCIECGNSIFRSDGERPAVGCVPEHRFELLALQAYCDQLLRVLSLRQLTGNPVIPYLVTYWSEPPLVASSDPNYGVGGDGYRVGDCLRRITGYNVEFRGGDANLPESYVDIVGLQFTPQDTTLLLDDFRWKDTVMPKGTAEYDVERK